MQEIFKKYNCIGILGGTFNPVHNGHIALADYVFSCIDGIEHIFFIPNNMPAYKELKNQISTDDRFTMLNLALSGYQNISVSDIEIKRGGYTYTIDTLEEIRAINPRIKIYFIVGADSLYSFTGWVRYRDILKLCSLIVLNRNSRKYELEQFADRLTAKMGYGEIHIIDSPNIDISSSIIRDKISNQESISDLVPAEVAGYIYEHKLYTK